MLLSMTSEARVEMRLEVNPASDPISGLLHDRRGEAHRFQGWLQFMSAVDTALSDDRETHKRQLGQGSEQLGE